MATVARSLPPGRAEQVYALSALNKEAPMRRGASGIIGVISALVVIFVVFRRFGTQWGSAADEQSDDSGVSKASHMYTYTLSCP